MLFYLIFEVGVTMINRHILLFRLGVLASWIVSLCFLALHIFIPVYHERCDYSVVLLGYVSHDLYWFAPHATSS